MRNAGKQVGVLYTDAMCRYVDELGVLLKKTREPIPNITHSDKSLNYTVILKSAILFFVADIEAGKTISGNTAREYHEYYMECRLGSAPTGEPIEQTHLYLNESELKDLETIGRHLDQRFSDRTLPKLFHGKGYNKKLMIAFAVYYTLDFVKTFKG